MACSGFLAGRPHFGGSAREMRGTFANVLLLCAVCGLPVERVDRELGGVLVEPPASNPAELLDCLRRHRHTPHACTRQQAGAALSTGVNASSSSSTPPPLDDCGAHNFSWLAQCARGRGHCAYDTVRGWHCRCNTATPELARGLGREAPRAERIADCLEW